VDSVSRFDDRVADYVRYRPGYPAAAIDAILENLAPAASLVAADVGAGTGISARLLGDRGVRVIAVEPGNAMRTAALRHPGVSWLAARAQATALAGGSMDLIVCAQSFHWFSTDEAVEEFARILAPNGRLAVVWNRRSAIDELTLGYRQAIVAAGGDEGIDRLPFDAGLLSRHGLFTPPDRVSVSNPQRLDLQALLGRARSASYAPKSGEAGELLRSLLTALHARHADRDGFVTLAHETEVYRSTRL
jgi:SAM-dependent methyltransferase